MLSKKWFDRRAVEGGKWGVVKLHKHYYSHTSYEVIERVEYKACPILNLPNHNSVEVLRNDLTKDEAMAMEKFLNFAEQGT
jgi:hypothetical protein